MVADPQVPSQFLPSVTSAWLRWRRFHGQQTKERRTRRLPLLWRRLRLRLPSRRWSDWDNNDAFSDGENVKVQGSPSAEYTLFLNSDGSVAIHAGERLGGGIITDAITTPVVNTSAYFFKKTTDLIDFKEKRRASFEYGRFGDYTTVVAEEKISTLEGAETTILMASGMCASTVMLMALVPAGIHLVTTTDCCRKTGIFIDTILPKMGITATVIDLADIGGLDAALKKNNVALFFTVSN